MSNPKKIRVDWFRVIADMERSGWSLPRVAEEIDVPRTTVQHWRNGGQAPYEEGYRLAKLWSSVTSKINLPLDEFFPAYESAEISAPHFNDNPAQQLRSQP